MLKILWISLTMADIIFPSENLYALAEIHTMNNRFCVSVHILHLYVQYDFVYKNNKTVTNN